MKTTQRNLRRLLLKRIINCWISVSPLSPAPVRRVLRAYRSRLLRWRFLLASELV
ncbi:hypothetical protein MTER_38850 [Mycolicibacter terrae]|uniref:Uncharacterized protein n=1 Tax=Mycolicibacter terrae TaxID=1788 RepID=A0AAD1I017_9MYCO|nr:hypothetical protein [Mycolicibacter terrae]BBX24474.1 hypothetical protein MTER_38850 [Mycolicibacter terrae]